MGRSSGFPLPRIREDRPRLHEDKLCGNDPPKVDRGFGGCVRNSLESPFHKGGLKGLNQAEVTTVQSS